MAEAVGLVTGLASLAISIAEGAARLRDLYKESKTISQEVESLLEDLKFLTFLVKGLEGLSTLDDHDVSLAISHCRKTVQNVASTLEEMTETLDAAEKKPRKTLSRMRWLSTKKKDLKKLQDLTVVAKLDILSMFSYPHHRRIPTSPPTPETHQRIGKEEEQEQPDRYHSEEVTPRPNTAVSNTLVAGPGRPRQRRTDCTRRACSCTCHIKGQITSRFWNFEYTPLSFILKGCSNPNCTDSEYVSELHIALTQLGWHRAITFGLSLTSTPGKYSIRPSLQIKEEVVRYTSRGFELILRFQEGLSDWQEVVQEFREMYQEDKRIIRHVNPAGRGYIGELLWWSTPSVHWGPTLRVLEVFMAEFKMITGLDDINFLYRMARWIGEGPHLSLFKQLLILGFDPGNMQTPSAERWPKPCNPNWISEQETPDPFFLELLSMMASVDSDFGGISPLQREILCGSAHSVAGLLDCGTVPDESNFLGQKALHLAVFNPECAPVLISAGYAVDAADRNGTTPLMYACAMGNIDIAKLLISEGAKADITDELRHRDYLDYALVRGHYNLAGELARFYQALFPEEAVSIGIYFARRIALFMCSEIYYRDKKFCFQELLDLASGLDFTFSDQNKKTEGNNIMHYPFGLSNAKTLMAAGFTGLEQKNSDGVTPVMECVRFGLLDAMDMLIEHGVDVNAQDFGGRSPMHYAVRAWHSSHPNSTDDTRIDHYRFIERLLQAGARVESHDLCRCPCSPKGCTPSNVLGAYFCHRYRFGCFRYLQTTVEWFCRLEENNDAELMKSELISFVQRARFDEMGITHTCCSGERGDWSSTQYHLFLRCASLPAEDRDTAMREHSHQIMQLKHQISLLETKNHQELRDIWLHQLRRSHDHYLGCKNLLPWEEVLRRATIPKKIPPSSKRKTYTINFQKDAFEFPSIDFGMTRDHSNEPIKQMVSLLWALEKNFAFRRGADEDFTELEMWYNRRLSWVIGILHCMDISRDLIAMKLRERGAHSWEKDDGPFAEAAIEHFLQSCELFHSNAGKNDMK